MKKKFYAMLCGAAVVAMAGAALVQNGEVAGGLRPANKWTPDAPAVTAEVSENNVTVTVTPSPEGYYAGNLTPEQLPAGFTQDITVYRAEENSYDATAATVYTKQNVAGADEVTFTETDLAEGTYYYYAVATNHANTERVSEPSKMVEVKVKRSPKELYVVGSFNNWSMTEGYITLTWDEDQEMFAGSSEIGDELAELQGCETGLAFMVYDQLENPNLHYGPSADAFGPVDCTFDTTEQLALYQGPIAAESFGYWQFPEVKAAPYLLGFFVSLDEENPYLVCQAALAPETPEENNLYIVGSFNDWSLTEGYITLAWDEESEMYAGSSEVDGELMELKGCETGLAFRVMSALEDGATMYGPVGGSFWVPAVDCEFKKGDLMSEYVGLLEENAKYWQFPAVKEAPYFLGFYVSLEGDEPAIMVQASLAEEAAPQVYVVGSFNDWSMTEGYITLTWDEDQHLFVGASEDEDGELMELKGCETGLAFKVYPDLNNQWISYGPSEDFLGNVDYEFEDGDMMAVFNGPAIYGAFSYWQFPAVTKAPALLGFALDPDANTISVQAALQPETPEPELPEELRIIGPWNNWNYEESTLILRRYEGEEEEGLDPGQYLAYDIEFPAVADGLIFRFADANGVQYGACEDDSEGVMADEEGIFEGEIVVGTFDAWWFPLQENAVAATVTVDLANKVMGVMFADAPAEGEVIPYAPEFTAEYDAAAKAVNATVTLPTKGEYTENWSTFEECTLTAEDLTKVEVVRTSGFEYDYVKTWTAEDGLTPGATLACVDNNVVEGKTYTYYAIVYCGVNTASSEKIEITIPEAPAVVVVKPVENLAVAYANEAQNELKATWENNAEVVAETVKGYTVYVNGEKAAEVEACEYSFSIAENTLPVYTVKVETLFSNDETAAAEVEFTVYTPAAVADVKAETNANLNGVNISWTAPEIGNPIGIKGYNVYVNGTQVNTGLLEATSFEYAFPEGTEHGSNWKIVVETVFANGDTLKSAEVEYLVDTSVEMILANDANAKVYTLQGVEVKNPENGIFIIVSNGKTFKAAIRK